MSLDVIYGSRKEANGVFFRSRKVSSLPDGIRRFDTKSAETLVRRRAVALS